MKFRLAEIELAESLGPGFLCMQGTPIVCRGAECKSARRGKAIAAIEVRHADGSSERRRIVHNRRKFAFLTCRGAPIEFRAGDRVRATVSLRQYPKTLLANSQGSESDLVAVRVGVAEQAITEPGRVKLDDVELNSKFGISDIFVKLRVCNGLDQTVEPFAISFRRDSKGKIRKYPSIFDELRPCSGMACPQTGFNRCKSGFINMTSNRKGKADGFIIEVRDWSTGLEKVVYRRKFEGPEYVHEWLGFGD